jgi:hypothetical protein
VDFDNQQSTPFIPTEIIVAYCSLVHSAKAQPAKVQSSIINLLTRRNS